MPATITSPTMTDRLLTPATMELVQALVAKFGQQRSDVLQAGRDRQAALRESPPQLLSETAGTREGKWTVDPVPAELLERRVELIGGSSRKALINGMNAGAKSYVADLWDLSSGQPAAILRAHKNIERATTNDLAYVNGDGERIRINPKSTTRLMVAPRPMTVTADMQGASVPAAFLDLVLFAGSCAKHLLLRQGGAYLYLRKCSGHAEAGLWNDLFVYLEGHFALPRGTFRATVMMDSLAAVLEAEEILFALRHHSAGLSLDPQAFAAEHIGLFNALDLPVLPDRGHIGLSSTFLRAVSLRTISICHKRQAHAMGAPAFVLPPEPDAIQKPAYLAMLADKEREAVDGHDGTLVGHAGLVNPAMTEFNKSMPRAHQMDYQRPEPGKLADLVKRPEGALTTEGLQRSIRMVLAGLVHGLGDGPVQQGGHLHDRASIRLSTLLVWHWTSSEVCFITDTGLEVHADVIKYLIRKEGSKLTKGMPAALQERSRRAVELLTATVMATEIPPDLLTTFEPDA